MAEGTPVTKNLEENEVWFRSRCEGCADIKLQPMLLGKGGSVHVLAIYVENTVPNLILEESVLGRMFIEMTDKTPGKCIRQWKRTASDFRRRSRCPQGKRRWMRCWREICCFWWTGTIRD